MNPEWTPEEDARLWPETRVLLDDALEQGAVREVTAGEASWVVEDADRWAGPYRMELTADSPFGLNASSYENWLTSPIVEDSGVFTLEKLEELARNHRHHDCPLFRCEDFSMRQTSVPVHDPNASLWRAEFTWRAPYAAPDFRRLVRIRNIDMGDPFEGMPPNSQRNVWIVSQPTGVDQSSVRFVDWSAAHPPKASRKPQHIPTPRLDGRKR